jgi:hypothetical protein
MRREPGSEGGGHDGVAGFLVGRREERLALTAGQETVEVRRVEPPLHELGLVHEPPEERHGRPDAHDAVLVERAAQPCDRFGARPAVPPQTTSLAIIES